MLGDKYQRMATIVSAAYIECPLSAPATETRQPRMSLSPSAILDAGRIFLLFSGAAKRAIYDESRRPGPIGDVPLRLVLGQAKTPVTVLIAP